MKKAQNCNFFIKIKPKSKKHVENKDPLPNQATDKTRSGHSQTKKRQNRPPTNL